MQTDCPDGELFAGRENFEKCGILERKNHVGQNGERGISYQVFDIPSHLDH